MIKGVDYLNSGTFKYIERMLYDYNEIEDHIDKRIEQLKYPYYPSDENIGGGKSNVISDPTGKLAVTIADDLLLSNLRRTKETIDVVLDSLEPDARRVIDLYYIDTPRKYTWDGVAMETNNSKSTCYRIRDEVFTRIAEKLGMPID